MHLKIAIKKFTQIVSNTYKFDCVALCIVRITYTKHELSKNRVKRKDIHQNLWAFSANSPQRLSCNDVLLCEPVNQR